MKGFAGFELSLDIREAMYDHNWNMTAIINKGLSAAIGADSPLTTGRYKVVSLPCSEKGLYLNAIKVTKNNKDVGIQTIYVYLHTHA